MSSTKRSQLQIFDDATLTNAVTITASLAKTTFASAANVPLEVNTTLSLKSTGNDSGGNLIPDVPDVAAKFKAIDDQFVSESATATADADAVQADLNSKAAAINSDIGTLQSDLATEVAAREAAQASDATARTNLDTTLRGLISDEATTARAAELANANALSALTTALNTSISDAATARTTAVNDLQAQLDFIKTNASAEAIDSISELLALVGGNPGTSVLEMITSLQTSVTHLQNVVDTLTNGTTTHSNAASPVYVRSVAITPNTYADTAALVAAGYTAVTDEAGLVALGFVTNSPLGIPITYRVVNGGADAAAFHQYSTNGIVLKAYVAGVANLVHANFGSIGTDGNGTGNLFDVTP